MADKIHRLAVEGELHRPERTGVGDPNEISFSFLEDGQYYQDTLTGSLWRFDENDDAWYLLIDYDKQSQEIRNVNTLNAFQNNVGKTTEDIGAVDGNVGTITSIPAYTYAQLREGEEIVVIDADDDLNYIFFTVSADTNAGEISIPVQSETTVKRIPSGAHIQMDASIIQSYFSVDPTKLEISFDSQREATSYGRINETVISAGTTKTFLQLSKSGVSVSEPLDFKDGQTLFLQRRTGESQLITVNGDQTFTSGFYTLNVNSFVTDFNMGSVDFTLATYLSEPAYKSSSRLTLAEGLIELNASNISDAYNAIAGINIVTNSLSASVNTSVQYNNAGAYIQLLAGPNGSEITLEANQINIDGVVTFINDQSSTTIDGDRITTGTITASQINVSDLFSQTIEVGNVIKSNNYVSGLSGFAIFANGQAEFRDVTVDGQIITGTGSELDGQYITANTISADKINVTNLNAISTNTGTLTVDNTITIGTGGSIQSSVFTAGSAGFQINANGSAEFNDVVVRTSSYSGTTDGILIEDDEIIINVPVTLGSAGGQGIWSFKTAGGTLVGRLAAAGAGGNTIYLWDAETGWGGLRAKSSTSGYTEIAILGDNQVLSLPAQIQLRQPTLVGSGNADTNYDLTINGDVRWNGTTSTSATAGGNGDVPAQVVGYLQVNISGTNYKIPYYAT